MRTCSYLAPTMILYFFFKHGTRLRYYVLVLRKANTPGISLQEEFAFEMGCDLVDSKQTKWLRFLTVYLDNV